LPNSVGIFPGEQALFPLCLFHVFLGCVCNNVTFSLMG
jgi:hypothetical protein